MLIENGANVYTIDQNGTYYQLINLFESFFHSGISVLHHAINSKNFETIAVIVRQLNKDKEFEINRPVGLHKWTPLYRAGK